MKARAEQSGFTIIELVVVIVLVGITGAVVISRFAEPNSFTVQAAQDGLLTSIRAAQQAALGRDGVTFGIDKNPGDEWVLTTWDGATAIRTMELASDTIVLQTGSAVASSDTCASAFDTDVDDLLLTFGARGDLTQFDNDGSSEPVDEFFNGVRICVNNTDEQSVCVSSAGYAYAGNCDE